MDSVTQRFHLNSGDIVGLGNSCIYVVHGWNVV